MSLNLDQTYFSNPSKMPYQLAMQKIQKLYACSREEAYSHLEELVACKNIIIKEIDND